MKHAAANKSLFDGKLLAAMNIGLKNSLSVLRMLVLVFVVCGLIIFVTTAEKNRNSEAKIVFATQTINDASGADLPPMNFSARRLEDNTIMPLPKSTLILVWSKDCLPCMEELRRYVKYSEAAKPLKLMTLSLDDRKPTQTVLSRLKIPEQNALFTNDDPEVVLEQLGSRPPLLPYALTLNATRQRCAQHTGLLGLSKIKQWAKQC